MTATATATAPATAPAPDRSHRARRRTVAGRLLASYLLVLAAFAITVGWSFLALRAGARDAELLRAGYVPLLLRIGEALAVVEPQIGDELGFGEPVALSAEHGLGLADLHSIVSAAVDRAAEGQDGGASMADVKMPAVNVEGSPGGTRMPVS